MLIVDPVALGDAACTRASPKWVFDKAGTLVQVPADTLAVAYDPSDLSKAPYALVEPAATNRCIWSADLGNWGWNQCTVALNTSTAPDGTLTADLVSPTSVTPFVVRNEATPPAGAYVFSVWVKGSPAAIGKTGQILIGNADYSSVVFGYFNITGDWQRAVTPAFQFDGAHAAMIRVDAANAIYVWGAQFEAGTSVTSYVPTAGSPAARAADIIAPGAGAVYSNVPIAERAYSAGATFALNELAYDPTTHNVLQSLIANNTGKALTDTAAWTPRGATNRWAMLDQYNNTQTSNPEEIILVVSPQTISRGLYIGNVDASEMRVSVVDQYKGLVYQEVQSLRVSTSGSSAYNWCFNRIKRKSWALSLKLPPYANALVTLCLRKPGGVAKCGMFAVGPIVDLGKTLMGLGAEIKDFSETSFNFDGTSKTQLRNYAKRITADVSVDSDQVDAVYEALADYRQRPIVWVGSQNYGLSIAFGRYSSFKPVIKGATRWEMSLQIEGTV